MHFRNKSISKDEGGYSLMTKLPLHPEHVRMPSDFALNTELKYADSKHPGKYREK